MKSSRFKYKYAENASKAHRSMGEVLRSGTFQYQKVYQEYPVSKINPQFSSGRHKFDWIILDLRIVIELHGEDHYHAIQRGNISVEESIERLHDIQRRDAAKKSAALDIGFVYILIPYWEFSNISEEYLLEQIRQSLPQSLPDTSNEDTKHILSGNKWQVKQKEYKEKQKIKARQYRKEQYIKMKEYLNKIKRAGNDDGAQNSGHSEDDPKTSNQEMEEKKNC